VKPNTVLLSQWKQQPDVVYSLCFTCNIIKVSCQDFNKHHYFGYELFKVVDLIHSDDFSLQSDCLFLLEKYCPSVFCFKLLFNVFVMQSRIGMHLLKHSNLAVIVIG